MTLQIFLIVTFYGTILVSLEKHWLGKVESTIYIVCFFVKVMHECGDFFIHVNHLEMPMQKF